MKTKVNFPNLLCWNFYRILSLILFLFCFIRYRYFPTFISHLTLHYTEVKNKTTYNLK